MRDAKDALIDALQVVGLSTQVPDRASLANPDAYDFIVEVVPHRFAVEVKSLVTAATADHVAERIGDVGLPVIVVADRIAAEAKVRLQSAGISFLDRRGELRLFEGSALQIHRAVPASVLPSGDSGDPLSSQVAKEVALACLLTPDLPHGVREIAEQIQRAPSAVSTAMKGLRRAGLVTSDAEALCPTLFEALAAVWRREPVMLASLPRPGAGRINDQLDLGLDRLGDAGWALTDTRAASSWGMPVVATGDYPPDFYVPSSTVLRRAVRLLGPAPEGDERACTVSVAPVRFVCSRRFDHSQTSGEEWPVANHIVVALDLATDRARGREILEQWQPKGITRAW